MKKEKLLQISKPILFNTEMVRAILDGRKTVTRRVIKPQPNDLYFRENELLPVEKVYCDQGWYGRELKAPYRPGDYLYVRETWSPMYPDEKSNDVVGYMYCADEGMSVAEYDKRYPNGKDYQCPGKWKPSIHMPKEAARILLRVTNMRVERLQEIEKDGLIKEGIDPFDGNFGELEYATAEFAALWDSTIKNKDRDKYGWDANPWVWVIEFEKINLSEVK